MPHWTLPINPEGLIQPVVLGLPLHRMTALQQSGMPVPPSLHLRALVDSGSDICIVPPHLVQQLALPQFTQHTAHSAFGPGTVAIYEASVILYGPAGITGPMLPFADLRVMEAAGPFTASFDMVIGLDILRSCWLFADWPGGQFTLGF